MIWVFVIAAALVSFVVAAVSIGGVTARLASRSRRTVYDLEQAVEFVADHLPDEITATVSYDDVRAVLDWHLRFLEARGVASHRTADDPGSALIVVDDAEPLAAVLGRVEATEEGQPGHGLTDEQVVAILAAEEGYYESIGAVGPRVDSPRDPFDEARDGGTGEP